MKQFEVIKDFKGSPDGCTVRHFEMGEIVKEYEFGKQDLCKVALREKWIKPVRADEKKEDPDPNKAGSGAGTKDPGQNKEE